jgi:hypothetical protein
MEWSRQLPGGEGRIAHNAGGLAMNIPERPKIHYSELPPLIGQLQVEHETYRANVGRLIAEGHEGEHILIKGSVIIGFWKTRAEALAEGHRLFPLQPIYVHEIQTYETPLRLRAA